MQINKNKTRLSVFALILMLSMIASSVAIFAPANAQTVSTTKSYFYVGVSPNIVGVGQPVIIVTWAADLPPDIGETAGTVASPNGRAAWNNPQTVNVIKPDGTNITLTLPRTDPVGADWIEFTPDAVGTYVLQGYFPGEWKNTTTSHRYYTPDYSAPANLTVQSEPTANWVETPLPTDYWMRPLNSANHDWYVLAGNWLGGAAGNYPQGTAGQTSNHVGGVGTETSHILWTKQYYTGGLMDENYSAIGYQTAHYEGISWTGIILNGKLSWTPRMTAHGTQGWEQVDLYTGEQLMLDYNATMPAFGQIYNYESPNQHGGFAYLWRTSNVQLPPQVNIAHAIQTPDNMSVIRTAASSLVNSSTIVSSATWEMLDGSTGKTICYIANASASGTAVYGIDGSILRYSLTNYGNNTNPNYHIVVWNSSYGTMPSSQLGTGLWQWRPAAGNFGASNPYFTSSSAQYNNVHDGRLFYSLNATTVSMVGAFNSISNQTASLTMVKQDDYLIATAAGYNNGTTTVPGFVIKVSLKPGQEGQLISKQEFIPPSSEGGTETVSLTGVYPDDGMILFQKTKQMQRYGISMDTGQLVWTGQPEVQFQYYGMSQNYYNHTLYSSGYGGVITAYDVKTGNVNWQYYPESIGTESAYGGVYPTAVVAICDGKLYTVSGEHSPTQPLFRGPNLRCLDASTGKEVWTILGFFGGMSPSSSNIIMADGVLVGLNYFDNQLYAFGKGPSATTVTTQNDISVLGTKIMLKGTVTDQSQYGRRDINDVLQFSLKGTPAISDQDQTAWMEYLYMQQAKPKNATGVPVSLDTIDPNGNLVHIGDTTSDMQGNYAIPYTPDIPGNYQIIATFTGSHAYGPSTATAYITVDDAPAATAAPSPQPVSITDQYFIPATVGIVIAIIAIGAIIILVQRKRA